MIQPYNEILCNHKKKLESHQMTWNYFSKEMFEWIVQEAENCNRANDARKKSCEYECACEHARAQCACVSVYVGLSDCEEKYRKTPIHFFQ